MKLATTTEDFERFCNFDRVESVRHLREAGFQYVDLSMYIVRPNDPLVISDDWRITVQRLKEVAKSRNIQYIQAHSPGCFPFHSGAEYEKCVAQTIRSIQVCGELGIPNIVVHAGFRAGMDKEEFFEKNRIFYSRFFEAMEACQVNVLVENSSRINVSDSYYLFTGADMKSFLEYVDHPLLHACWDTGHANMNGPQYEDIVALGEDLYALHINDNRGTGDEHTIPYFGTVNMDEIMNALLHIGYQGYFTFEACNTLRPASFWVGHRRKFERDTRLSEPTLEMQKELEQFMYMVGKHILQTYECFEE